MSLESAMRDFSSVAKWVSVFSLGFWLVCAHYNNTTYLPWVKTVAEICVPVYILTFVELFLLHKGYNSRIVVFFGRFVWFVIILFAILGADYIVSGRYKDGVDLVGGFMQMDFGWRIVIVVATVAFLRLDQWKNSWAEEGKK